MVESGGEEWELLVRVASRPGTGTQEWDDDKKTTRRDSRKGTLQDDGLDVRMLGDR